MPSGDAHRSLARALDILELCSLNGSGYTLTQLSQQLGIAKGSISPLLHTLRDRGYLTLDDQDHHYRIGRMAFRIGNTYLDEASALREIYRLMHDIVSVCHETCHLGSLKNGDVYYLKKVETPLRSRTVTVEGRSLPAYATGVGKALLADYQLPQLKALYYDGLYPLTEHTITDFRLLADQLAEIRASGFAYECEESTRGIRCIGVPLCAELRHPHRRCREQCSRGSGKAGPGGRLGQPPGHRRVWLLHPQPAPCRGRGLFPRHLRPRPPHRHHVQGDRRGRDQSVLLP